MKVRIRHRKGRGFELIWNDATGARRTKAIYAKDARDAERAAAIFEEELNRGYEGHACTLLTLVDAARESMYEGKSSSYVQVMDAAINAARDTWGWSKDVSNLKPSNVTRFRKELLSQFAEATVNTYMRHVRVLLKWGKDTGLVQRVPKFEITSPKVEKSMRCQALNRTSFGRIEQVCKELRPDDLHLWYNFIEGLFHSGLRLGEGLILSWDDGPFQIDESGRHPMFKILAEGQKGRRDEWCPIAPDAWDFFCSLAGRERTGSVFNLPFTRNYVSNVVSDILTCACGSKVTAHDLRRAFGTRWAMKLRPAALMKLMRHTNIDTTMKFYVNINAEDVADQLWLCE